MQSTLVTSQTPPILTAGLLRGHSITWSPRAGRSRNVARLCLRSLSSAFVHEAEDPSQYADNNRTAHDDRPAVPGTGTTVENIGAGDLTVYARGLTKRLFSTS